jgi:antitoxin component of MazEF toxin-antitoxin module
LPFSCWFPNVSLKSLTVRRCFVPAAAVYYLSVFDNTQEDPSPVEVETMSTLVKADASGTVTLPAELCRAAGVEPGADLVAEVQDGRIVLEPRRIPIWERIAALTADAPEEELAKLPPGGAAEIDKYLYGGFKPPE